MLLTDVDGWGGGLTGTQQSGYVAIGATIDEIKAARFGVRHDVELGPLTGIEFGLNRTNRTKSRDTDEGSLLIGTGPYGAAPMPGNETVVTRQSGIPVASWNPLGSLGSVYHQLAKVDQVIQTDKNWHISEKVSTAYVMGSREGELFGLPYRGNAGAQYIHTSQGSTGLIVDNGRCAGVAGQACPAYTIAGHHSYNDFLPSLNLNVELPADQVLRLGIGKTLSRPNMSDMRPGGGVGLDATNPAGPILAGGSGNPKLEPFRAKSFDLSYEKYFEANGAKGYVAMAGFYKKLVDRLPGGRHPPAGDRSERRVDGRHPDHPDQWIGRKHQGAGTDGVAAVRDADPLPGRLRHRSQLFEHPELGDPAAQRHHGDQQRQRQRDSAAGPVAHGDEHARVLRARRIPCIRRGPQAGRLRG
jgi:iron complex outermembrane receptor protein